MYLVYENKIHSIIFLVGYLCWWTINPRAYHRHSNRCFGTDIVYSIYCLSKFSSYVTGDRSRFWLSCLGTLGLSVPDEGYSRSVSCALNLISTFFFNLQSGNDFTSIPKTRTWCTAPTDILQYLLL
jgi:hypothetical protein